MEDNPDGEAGDGEVPKSASLRFRKATERKAAATCSSPWVGEGVGRYEGKVVSWPKVTLSKSCRKYSRPVSCGVFMAGTCE